MKVLQIIPMFKLAGAETMCENLCYALRKQGCDVIAVSLYTEPTPITERLENAGIRVVYLNKKLGLDCSIFIKLYQLMKKEKPNVVHTHIGAARYALPIVTLCRIPVKVHTVHNIAQKEQEHAGKLINGFMFKYCGVIPVALSDKVKRTIEEVYKLPARKIPVIFNGINLTKCQVKEDYTKKSNFKILHIGRFMDVKNHSLILKSFAVFVNRHPDARLQLLGEGELREDMIQLAKKLNIADYVEFAGLQSNVYPWLHDADIFILPSKYEGIPMTLIEAMGTGLPIIASAVGGIPDMLTDKENALLIKPNSDELVEAMEILYQSETMREEFGKKVKERAIVFSSEEMAQRYERIYLNCGESIEVK